LTLIYLKFSDSVQKTLNVINEHKEITGVVAFTLRLEKSDEHFVTSPSGALSQEETLLVDDIGLSSRAGELANVFGRMSEGTEVIEDEYGIWKPFINKVQSVVEIADKIVAVGLLTDNW
jgi:hypothetical protein